MIKVDSAADAVVCNLAVHYFLGNTESMQNFVALVSSLLKSEGEFSFVFLLGDRIHDKFISSSIKQNEKLNYIENGTLKYSLQKLYSGDKLENAGQKINVLLPFSQGKYYEENLVNIDALTVEFGFMNMKRRECVPIENKLETFEKVNNSVYAELTKIDKEYLSLFGYAIFVKE